MKRLLSILGTISILASTSSAVVACKNDKFERFDTPAIADEIKKWIIAEINGNADYVQYSFNQIFNSADLKTLAIRLLDSNISKFYYSAEEATRARYTGVTIDTSQPDNIIARQIINFVKQVALDKLYTEYLAGISNNSPLEYKMASQGYAPDYQTDNWFVLGVKSYFYDKAGSGRGSDFPLADYAKSRAELEKDAGYKFKIDQKLYQSSYDDFNKLSEDAKKVALKVRFNDYYNHVEIPSVVDQILATTYLHQNQIRKYGTGNDSHLYINKNGALFNNIQSWEDNPSSRTTWKSYIKMVWEVKMSKTKLEKKFPYSKIKTINDAANGTDKKAIIDLLQKDFAVDPASPDTTNQIKDGIDPIFNVPGFKGFVGFKKSDNSIFTTINNADLYKNNLGNVLTAGIMRANNGPTDQASTYEFVDANKRNASLVFVLPIYTIDLMNNMTLNYQNKQITDANKLEMKFYGSGGQPTDLNANWLVQGLSVKWLYNSDGYLGSYDNTGTPLYNPDGSPTSVNNYKGNILKWIEYTMAQNTDLQKSGKTRLYSLAFNNDPKNIYSQTLYDAIGTYIISRD